MQDFAAFYQEFVGIAGFCRNHKSGPPAQCLENESNSISFYLKPLLKSMAIVIKKESLVKTLKNK